VPENYLKGADFFNPSIQLDTKQSTHELCLLPQSYTPTFSPTASEFAMPIIRKSQTLLEKFVFISYTSSGVAYPSVKYTFENFYDALHIMALQGFGGDYSFFLGNDDKDQYIYGLVNLAAFLANAMVESIQYDTCDELNWQAVAGRYAISNSCGQDGRSYQDEICEEKYTCEVETTMEQTAVDSGKGTRAPPPFTCRAGSGDGYYSGYWDTSSGTEITNTPYSSTTGRTDVEGCCWWGRGALLTRNVCNIGKLNYWLGSKAALDGRSSLYPNTDFCNFPEATCSSNDSEEMRWTVAMFEWAERVQTYSNKWTYTTELTNFVDGGMTDDSFIMSASRVLSNGCHEIGCSTIEVRMADQRKANFYLIINDIFHVKYLNTEKPTQQPAQKPKPTLWTLTSSTTYADTESATPYTGSMPVEPELSPPALSPPSSVENDVTSFPTFDAELISLEGNAAAAKEGRLISIGALIVSIVGAIILIL
jgi:hypothetical protein